MPGTDLFARYVDANYVQPEGKVLLANRAYIATADAIGWAPTARVGNTAPTPTADWQDVGSLVDSRVTIAIAEPEIINVETGLFRKLRGQIGRKAGEVTFNFRIAEYEPEIWNVITGRTVRTPGTPALGERNRHIGVGGQIIISKSVLIIGQNAASGVEFQHYVHKGRIRFTVEEADEFTVINATVTCIEYDAADRGANALSAWSNISYEEYLFKVA